MKRRYRVVALDRKKRALRILGKAYTRKGAEEIAKRYQVPSPIPGFPMHSYRIDDLYRR